VRIESSGKVATYMVLTETVASFLSLQRKQDTKGKQGYGAKNGNNYQKATLDTCGGGEEGDVGDAD